MSTGFELLPLFLVRDIPKIALMLLVLGYLLLRILRMPQQTLRRARSLAVTGIAMLITSTIITPILYALLAWSNVQSQSVSQFGYAIVGGVFTLVDAVALLLLGLAVLAGRQTR